MTPLGELLFLLPSGSDAVSGGNIYNAELLRALVGRAPARGVERATFLERLAAGAPGVYCVDSLDLHEAALFPQRKHDQRLVLVVHHLPSLEPQPNTEAVELERAALPRFDGYLCTSPFTSEVLTTRGFDLRRIMTVTPGLPAVELGPPGYEPPLRALFVGNLVARKGVLPLLEALAAQAYEEDTFSLEIRGRDDLEPSYANACRGEPARSRVLAERVRFLAPVPYGEMGAVYRRSGLLVSAASMETYGMALAEARAHGVPILTQDGGYARHHVIEGETGATFSTVDALADEFLRLARNPEATRTLRENARRRATPGVATWSRAATELLAELERCFARRA